MTAIAQWLVDLGTISTDTIVDGLVLVAGYKRDGQPPEEVIMMEKAASYKLTPSSSRRGVTVLHLVRKCSFLFQMILPMTLHLLNCINDSGVGAAYR